MRLLPIALAATLSGWTAAPAQSRQPDQDPLVVPFAERHPELANLSSQQQQTTREPAVDKSRRGVYPVGNGSVFGYFGLGATASTVQGLSGPTYQTDVAWAPHGHFGEQSFALFADRQEVLLPRQRIARVRGRNLVVTEDRNEAGITLTTLNFSPAGDAHLYRIVEVHNGSEVPLRGLELIAKAPAAEPAAEDELRSDYASTQRPYRASFRFVADGFVVENQLVRPFGELGPGSTARTIFAMHTWNNADTGLWVEPTAAVVERLLAECLQGWQRRLADTATFTSDPPQVADLIEDWKVLLLAQRSEVNGLVAPMVNHRVCRVRDLHGPLLLCLRYNLWSDARGMLRAIWRATNHYGALREELPLDEAWHDADPTKTPWDAVTIPNGGLGSLVVLFHAWYWRATGDTALVRAHLPLLRRCLDGQRFTPDGLQVFAGTEAHLALHRLLEQGRDEPAGLVAHDPAAGRSALSFDAGALYVVANLAMGELQGALAPPVPAAPAPGPQPANAATPHIDPTYVQRTIEVARLVEGRFWQIAEGRFAPALSPLGLAAHNTPIADSNLRLQWLGWTFASLEKNRHNLQSTLQSLWRAPDAVRVGMTPSTGFATGETPALLLYALADFDDRASGPALAELLRIGGPGGEWGELHGPEGLPAWSRDPQWPDRCQPGPSGVAIDAICFALTGIRYATVPGWDDDREARFRPRLPPATTSFDWRDIRHDGRHLHLHVSQRLAKLGPEELERQQAMVKAGMLEAKEAKDPALDHLRFRYRIEMVNPPPDAQHIVCSVNRGRDTLVRYLAQSLPAFEDTGDPPINQQDAWSRRERTAPAPLAPTSRPLPAVDTLLLTARADAARRHAGPSLRCIDLGLPLAPQELALMLVTDGRPNGKRLVFDIDVLDRSGLTSKGPAFWQHPDLRQGLAAFTRAGGEVITPVFVGPWMAAEPFVTTADRPFETTYPALQESNWPGAAGSSTAWQPVDCGANGYVDLRHPGPPAAPCVRAAATWLDAAAVTRCVLRAGSDEALQVLVDGKVVLAQPGFGTAAADQVEASLELAAGAHRVVVVVADTGGATGFHLRLVGTDGLPVPGLSVRRP